MNFRDIELLSAYLDGQLSRSDSARLEARVASDASLKAELERLRETRGVLRRLPMRRAPRNFTLTPKMAGVKPPEPRAYPVFRFATVLAAFLFMASIALNGLAPVAQSRLAAAPAPVYGMGGGGGGSGGAAPPGLTLESAPAATEAGPQAFAALAPTPTAAGTEPAAPTLTADSSSNLAAPTQPLGKAAPIPPRAAATPAPGAPVPLVWVIVLGLLMIACAGAAWILRLNNERRIRAQWNRK